MERELWPVLYDYLLQTVQEVRQKYGQPHSCDTYHVLPWDGPAPVPSKTSSRVRLGSAWDFQEVP